MLAGHRSTTVRYRAITGCDTLDPSLQYAYGVKYSV